MKFLFSFEALSRKSIILYLILRYLFIKLFRGILFEKEANGFKKIKIKKNLNIIDIGVNDGLSTSFFLKIFNNSRFYIFEPLKFNKSYLKNNRNNLVKYYNFALGEKNSSEYINIPYTVFFSCFKFYLSAYSTISNSKNDVYEINKSLKTFFNYKKLKNHKIKIKIKKLDNLKIRADIIKLDVEGHEDQVINGAKNTIKTYKPLLYIERPSINIIKILKKLEYEIYIFDIQKNLFIKTNKISKKFRNYYFFNKKRKLFK
tara:strand:+ start:145 stop:921 length:777 start_codon:yes stop_codon:yes gene_type:complete